MDLRMREKAFKFCLLPLFINALGEKRVEAERPIRRLLLSDALLYVIKKRQCGG